MGLCMSTTLVFIAPMNILKSHRLRSLRKSVHPPEVGRGGPGRGIQFPIWGLFSSQSPNLDHWKFPIWFPISQSCTEAQNFRLRALSVNVDFATPKSCPKSCYNFRIHIAHMKHRTPTSILYMQFTGFSFTSPNTHPASRVLSEPTSSIWLSQKHPAETQYLCAIRPNIRHPYIWKISR